MDALANQIVQATADAKGKTAAPAKQIALVEANSDRAV